MDLNEHKTRSQLIDHQLEKAGWRLDDRTQVRREVPTANAVREAPDAGDAYDVTDNCLYDEDGCILAVVECKRTSRNPREGEEQLRLYIADITRQQPFAPFGFMANGLETCFWEVGLANPRAVAGFFTRADLSEEDRNALIGQGLDPDSVRYEVR